MDFNLSDSTFVNNLVPYNMAYCFNTNCPKTDSCFRFLAAKFRPEDMTSGNAVYPNALQDGKCKYFIRLRVYNAAWGFHNIFDDVRQKDAAPLKQQIMTLLEGRNFYYRYHQGKKLLSPEQQEAINKLFNDKGYEAPVFTHYEEAVGLTSNE